MGIIRSSFSFLLGTGCGIYIAQNCNVPDIKKKLVNTWMFVAKTIEEAYRKPTFNLLYRCHQIWRYI
ncbi:uncharacterized protein LOC109829936 [Asparagus officinalis]|uniref:uncharacterized protein LOC109829936 n=1 Tax=Asparagus officinalis TaxID=4686 RepID=UPI00098E26CC|nr:uncharacterized protein LOC109829936 [Asparagus officinalis]XP_020252626.1 uncharacterized protein LOC109829936 [Asparagus officinalis]